MQVSSFEIYHKQDARYKMAVDRSYEIRRNHKLMLEWSWIDLNCVVLGQLPTVEAELKLMFDEQCRVLLTR